MLKRLENADPSLILPEEIDYWCHPVKCAVLGNTKEGYILTPVFDHMKILHFRRSPHQTKGIQQLPYSLSFFHCDSRISS